MGCYAWIAWHGMGWGGGLQWWVVGFGGVGEVGIVGSFVGAGAGCWLLAAGSLWGSRVLYKLSYGQVVSVRLVEAQGAFWKI